MNPCFTDPSDGTILDSCTGLQWEKKTTAVGSGANAADLHDVDNLYSWVGCCDGNCFAPNGQWCQPNAAAAATCTAQASGGTNGCSVCASGTCDPDPFDLGTITTVWDWVNQVNAANFAGHSDWRLPSEEACNSCWSGPPTYTCGSCTPHELETILLAPFLCGHAPCIDSIFGPTRQDHYWSASMVAGSPLNAWIVFFQDGRVDVDAKYLPHYVRAVRSTTTTPTTTTTSSTTPTLPCTGTTVGGFCWYEGASGADCDMTCAGQGKLYDEATRTYAGSDGTDQNCAAVATAFGAPIFAGSAAFGFEVGCAHDPAITARDLTPTTASGAKDLIFRFCACQ